MHALGDPTSYLQLEPGVPVFSADGERIGTVEHVLADADVDIFDGLVVDARDAIGGHRFVDAGQIEQLHVRGVVLTLPAEAAQRLPEPSENPAVLSADPDDTTPDTLSDKLRRAWEYLSGKY